MLTLNRRIDEYNYSRLAPDAHRGRLLGVAPSYLGSPSPSLALDHWSWLGADLHRGGAQLYLAHADPRSSHTYLLSPRDELDSVPALSGDDLLSDRSPASHSSASSMASAELASGWRSALCAHSDLFVGELYLSSEGPCAPGYSGGEALGEAPQDHRDQ